MYDDIITNASEKYGVDENLIKGIIQTESKYNPDALGMSGEKGLMQLSPSTARSLGVTNPYDAEQNIMGGTKYLSMLLDNNNGDVDRALSAYNQGQKNLDKYGIRNQTYLKLVKHNMPTTTVNPDGSVSTEPSESQKKQTKMNLFGNVLVIALCIIIVLIGFLVLLASFTGTANPKKAIMNKVTKKMIGGSKPKTETEAKGETD